MARFCSQCGNEIEPDSKFCSKCGNPTENESIQNVSTQVAQNKSTGKNNMLIVALIAAIILIGGIGGYIFFGRSSDDKKSAALSQSNTTQQTTNPVESVPPPKPVEKPVPSAQQFSVNQNSPRDAFISFHMAITKRQLAEAYNILSPNYQKFMRSYDNFVVGIILRYEAILLT